jgi:UDP-N-acetylglucosamine:LPS N-acetylglucosamine transferase
MFLFREHDQGEYKRYMERDYSFKTIVDPVLLLSNKVGSGHHSVAMAIKDKIPSQCTVYHHPIEDLLGQSLRNLHFPIHPRIRYVLYRRSLMLNMMAYFPLTTFQAFMNEKYFGHTNLDMLRNFIESNSIRTVITTSQKAALFVSILKHRGEINSELHVYICHYYIGKAWQYLFWDSVDIVFVPMKNISSKFITAKRTINAPLPIDEEFYRIAEMPEDGNAVLLTGGGWGIGPIHQIVRTLARRFPELVLHVACGENTQMFDAISKRYSSNKNIICYEKIPSLVPLIKKCSCIIMSPGAISLTEGNAVHRKVFIIPDSILERKMNARYAIQEFNMDMFSLRRFSEWYLSSKGGQR